MINTCYSAEAAARALGWLLQLWLAYRGYVVLLLVHLPGGFGLPGSADPNFPRKARATIWRTFCEIADKGAARAIGVSNFTISHLRQLMEDVPEPELRSTVNHVEIHPYCRVCPMINTRFAASSIQVSPNSCFRKTPTNST